MDKSFNGLRYSASLGCLVDDSGERFLMRHNSTQIFLYLAQNLNELVSREHLLSKVSGNGPRPDVSLNECIDEIRFVVGDDRLKTIPRVGYLLTPDASTSHSAKSTRVRSSSLVQELAFNFQWITATYQRRPRAWIGTVFLVAGVAFSSAGTSAKSTSGHIAYDREDANVCSTSLTNCYSCVPDVWQTSSIHARSNWFVSTGCK